MAFSNTEPISAGPVVDAAAAIWPAPHAAFLRLFLAAVIARYHLGRAGGAPHPGFVIVGEPRTGKTALFTQACHLLGLDVDDHVQDLAVMTPGELLGRRSAAGGTMAFTPARYLRRPLVLLDEFDKASEHLRDRAQKVLLQGSYRTTVEDEPVTIGCAPMIAANLPSGEANRFAQIHPAYRTRRSILLDSGTSAAELEDLGDKLRRFYETHPTGQLRLADLTPPTETFTGGRPLWNALRSFLAPGHELDFPDERSLDLLTLGYAALQRIEPDDDYGLQIAAFYVLVDWHACASTVAGLIDPKAGYPHIEMDATVREYLDGRSDFASLEAAITHHETSIRSRDEQEQQRMHRRVHVHDDVVRARGELDAQLQAAKTALDARKIPAEHRPAAKGLRDVLTKLSHVVVQASTFGQLEEARKRCDRQLEAARDLLAGIERQHTAIQRDREATARDAQAQRQDRAAMAAAQRRRERQIKERASSELSELRARMKDLERLYRRKQTTVGEDVLGTLRELELATFTAAASATSAVEEPSRQGFLARLTSRPGPVTPPGQWHTAGGNYPGYPTLCTALSKWGDATRAAIAPALRDGYAREDALVAQLHRAARTGRVPRSEIQGAQRRTVPAPSPGAPRSTAADKYNIGRR